MTNIYSDYGVSVPLREAALDVVSTWEPDPAFWHKIARLSWREPSKRFASFITSLIETYADSTNEFMKGSSQAASHALKFARPTAPTHDYSQIFWSIENDYKKHVEKTLGGALYVSKSFKHLTEVFTFMMYDLGGIQVVVSEGYAIASDLFVGKRIFEDFGKEEININKIAAKVAEDFYNRIEETVKTKPTIRNPKTTLELSWTLFNHIQLFLPLNKETVAKLPFSDVTKIGALLVQLAMGYDLVLGKFFIPFDFTTIFPTEGGIPLIISGTSPILLTSASYSSLTSESKTPGIEFVKKAELSVESLSSFSTMFQTSLSFLLPWNKKLYQTGVRASRDLTLPFKETLKGRELTDEGHQHLIHYDIQSQYKKKFSAAKASNVPYTGIFPIIAVEGGAPTTSFKKVVNTEPKYKHLQPLPVKYTGLELDLKIGSETSLPFTLFGGENILSPIEFSDAAPWVFYILASPTVKFWEIDLTFDPEKSTTKKITIEQMFGTFGKSKPEALTQETGDFYQYGQEGLGQYDQEGTEQISQTPSFDFQEGFQEIGNAGTNEVETLAHVNYGDSIQQRSQKMQEFFGGLVKTVGLKVDLDGDEHRSFEILLSLSKSKPDDSTKIKKFQLSFIRSPIPHVDDKPASVCIDVQKSVPFITSLDTLKGVLSRELKKEFKAEVTLGCTGQPVFVAKGSYELSDAWKKKYEEVLHEACDYDEQDPLYTFNHHAVYDQAKFTLTWDKVCDPERFPITSKLFGFLRHSLESELFHTSCKETESKLKIDFERCPINTNWYIEATRGESSTKFENIPHDPVFNFLFGIVRKDDSDFIPSHQTPFNMESDKCIVGVDKVKTFDGFKYEYHPTQCWTVAFKDCFDNNNMLLVRSPQGESSLPEARYIDTYKGLVIEFSRNTIRVNGKIVDPIGGPEIIKDESDEVTLVKIYKKNDYYKVKLDDDFYILFKDQIEIKVDFARSGHTCGLCGDSDGEPEAELVGPHRCLFSDPNLFVSSWTAGSDTCDLYTLMELRQEVEQFQEAKCRLIEDYEDKCEHRNSPCIYYQWHIVNDGKDYDVCVSSRPLSFCKPECEIQTYEEKMFTYSCWPQEHVPEFVKSALESNQTTILQPPMKYEPYYETSYSFNVPTTCKRY